MKIVNAERIKNNIEACIERECENCSYDEQTSCKETMLCEALALIESQEQRIEELTEENEYLKSTDIGELQQEYDSLAKSLEDAIELIDKLRAKKAKLTEENERLRSAAPECVEKVYRFMLRYVDKLSEIDEIDITIRLGQIVKEMLGGANEN